MLEVLNSALGPKIGLWHRTLDRMGGKWVQADRGALPSQSVWACIDAPTLVTQEMLTTAGAMLAQEGDR